MQRKCILDSLAMAKDASQRQSSLCPRVKLARRAVFNMQAVFNAMSDFYKCARVFYHLW